MAGDVPLRGGGPALTYRLLLDAHLSPKRHGKPLERLGHDVFALAADKELEGMSDAQVLELGSEERRIVVTRDGQDFSPLARTWAADGRDHAGVLLIWSIDLCDYARIVAAIHASVTARTPEEWRGLTTGI